MPVSARKAILMGENARNIQIDPLSLQGFDDLLEDSPPAPPPKMEGSRNVHLEPPPPKMENPPLGWTLKQAAKELGISVNTVRKRLLSGQLEGLKVESPYGYEWRVYPPTDVQVGPPPIKEDTPRSASSSTHSIVEGTSSSDIIVTNFSEPSLDRLLGLLESHTEIIKELHAELVRKDHIIESKEAQLKLLTDTQHRNNWIKRFSNWFLGKS